MRTLYASLGPSGWTLHGYRAGKLGRIVVDSRTPVPLALRQYRVIGDLGRLKGFVEKLVEEKYVVYNVRERGGARLEAGFWPNRVAVVIDYRGELAPLLDELAKPVTFRGYPLVYEAVLFIHLYAMSRRQRASYTQPAIEDPRLYMGFARKLGEAIRVFDNHLLVEPTTVSYILSKLLRRRGLVAEPSEATVRLDYYNGSKLEEVKVPLYSVKGLRRVGEAIVKLGTSYVELVLPRGEHYRYVLDTECRRLILYDGTSIALTVGSGI